MAGPLGQDGQDPVAGQAIGVPPQGQVQHQLGQDQVVGYLARQLVPVGDGDALTSAMINKSPSPVSASSWSAASVMAWSRYWQKYSYCRWRPDGWDDLPDIPLYMDQVVGYLARQLVPVGDEL